MRIDEIKTRQFRAAGVEMSARELALLLAFLLALLTATAAAVYLFRRSPGGDLLGKEALIASETPRAGQATFCLAPSGGAC
ncbi:MAG TPA: hypothetical protein VF142_16105 [Longimicrobium sp.]